MVMELMILGVSLIICAFVLRVQIDGPQIGCSHADPLSGDEGWDREWKSEGGGGEGQCPVRSEQHLHCFHWRQ